MCIAPLWSQQSFDVDSSSLEEEPESWRCLMIYYVWFKQQLIIAEVNEDLIYA